MKIFNSNVVRRDKDRLWRLGTNQGNLVSLILRFGYFLTFVLGGHRHARFFLAVVHYGRWLRGWRAGRFSLVRYLKACQVTLMQVCSGGPVAKSSELGGKHRRAKGGIPSLIPVYHRVAIRRGDISVLRFWLSLLGVYRLIEVKGKLSLETITAPGVMKSHKQAYWLGTFLDHIQKVTPLGRSLLKRWSLDDGSFKFRPRAILTSGANVPGGVGAFWAMAWDASILWDSRLEKVGQGYMDLLLSTAQPEVFELIKNCALLAHRADDSMKLLEKRARMKTNRIRQALKSFQTLFSRKSEGDGRFTWKRAPWQNFKGNIVLGRLHQIPEPAGKIRVVAMTTWWIQVLLYPVHRKLYSLLRTIPQDGTWDQTAPLEELLVEIKSQLTHGIQPHVFSFDLKAATDRFPIWYQVEVLTRLTNRRFAEAWADLLVSFPYYLGGIAAIPRGAALRYGSGQPMGVYSSWAMFSLCHHILVQQAAHRAGFVGWYPWYALLGDDIVILGKAVALEYQKLCSDLGVTIGLAKSLVSENGSFEFAKRFYFKGQDCSPTSLQEYLAALSGVTGFIELISRLKRQNPSLRLADVIRGAKYGYHSVGKLTQRMVSLGNTRLANLLVLLMAPGGPFEQPIASLFSSTSTAVRPDVNLVDTPITERRVKSVARTLGQTLVSQSARATEFLGSLDRLSEHLRDFDPLGVLRYVVMKRELVVRSNRDSIAILGRLGRYLLDGKLRSRGLVTLLGKILPVWRASSRDVASLPDPFSLDALGGPNKPRVAPRFLKIRVRALGLSWKGRSKARITLAKTKSATPHNGKRPKKGIY